MLSTGCAERAAELVNADLTTTGSLAAVMAHRPWLAERAAADDLGALRSVQGELAALVDAPADGQGAVVVEVLDRLRARNPLRPSVSARDESRWPLPDNDEDATVGGTLTSEAMLGLMLLVTEVGATRLGRRVSPNCTRAYVDTGANRSSRFCRSRCSTRENVAALRRRRAAGVHR